MSKISTDKLLHAFVCLDVVFGVYLVLSALLSSWLSLVIAVVLAAALGVGKELYDAKTTGIDKGDLIADGIGILIGTVVIILVKTLL